MMKNNDKKTLYILAGALFVMVFFVRVVPWAVDYYRSGRDDIARLQKNAERYRTLIVDTAQWQQREQLKSAEVKDLESWVFPGTDANLVSSSIQRSLRQVFAENNVEVRQTGVPKYSYVGKWLMVEQDVDFSLSQSAILPVLRAIDALRPRLQVAAFKINRNRRAYTGSLTVVGFARAADKSGSTASTAASNKNGENGVRAQFPATAPQSQVREIGNGALSPFSPAVKP